MLDAPRGRSAKREGKGSNDAARGMPSAIAKEQQDRAPGAAKQAENIRIDRRKARLRVDVGKQQGG